MYNIGFAPVVPPNRRTECIPYKHDFGSTVWFFKAHFAVKIVQES